MTPRERNPALSVQERRRRFARLIAEGEMQVEAYRHACAVTKKKPSDVVRASEMAARDDVRAMIAEFSKQADERAVLNRRERMMLLSRQALAAAEEGDRRGLVSCVDVLNKMDGAYQPERIEFKGELGVASVLAALQVKQEPFVANVDSVCGNRSR